MIMRIALGLGIIGAAIVFYPDIKPVLDNVIATLVSTVPAIATFPRLVLDTMPYWLLAVVIICGVLLMIGGRGGGDGTQ